MQAPFSRKKEICVFLDLLISLETPFFFVIFFPLPSLFGGKVVLLPTTNKALEVENSFYL